MEERGDLETGVWVTIGSLRWRGGGMSLALHPEVYRGCIDARDQCRRPLQRASERASLATYMAEQKLAVVS